MAENLSMYMLLQLHAIDNMIVIKNDVVNVMAAEETSDVRQLACGSKTMGLLCDQ
jgi:hypothetical protein